MRRIVFGMHNRVELTKADKIKVAIMSYLRHLNGTAATAKMIHRKMVSLGLVSSRGVLFNTARIVCQLAVDGMIKKVKVVSSDGRVAYHIPKQKIHITKKTPE